MTRTYAPRDVTAFSERLTRHIEEEFRLPDGRTAVIHGMVSGTVSCERGQGFDDDIETHVHLVEVWDGDRWVELAGEDPAMHHVGVHIMEHEEEWFSRA